MQETADDAALSKVGAILREHFITLHFLMGRTCLSALQLSAVRMGYLSDPFFSYFVQKPQRRSPLINRGEAFKLVASQINSSNKYSNSQSAGYYARVAAMDLITRGVL